MRKAGPTSRWTVRVHRPRPSPATLTDPLFPSVVTDAGGSEDKLGVEDDSAVLHIAFFDGFDEQVNARRIHRRGSEMWQAAVRKS